MSMLIYLKSTQPCHKANINRITFITLKQSPELLTAGNTRYGRAASGLALLPYKGPRPLMKVPDAGSIIIRKRITRLTRRALATFSTGPSKGSHKTKAKSKGNQKKTSKKSPSFVPSSGFIGKTNFSLLEPMFQKFLPEGVTMATLLDKTIKAHDHFIKHHGVVEGSAKWKAITLYATLLLEGREIRKSDVPGWVATGAKDKWPNKLSHLRPLYHYIIDNVDNDNEFDTCVEIRRCLVTLFKLNRVCSANKTIDLTKAKAKFKLDPGLVAAYEQFVRKELAEIRESITPTDLHFDLFLSPSKGPNRLPAQESALIESAALYRHKTLHAAFKDLCTLTGNTNFYLFFEQCAKKMLGLKSKLARTHLRRIGSQPDKGNRSRVFAICDLWTQSVLASLETLVLKVTYQLFPNNCCFFSHSKGWAEITSQPQEVLDSLASLDATEWTDNLPASLQLIVVKGLLGQKIANAWKALAVDCEWFVPGMPRPFKYGKGQGMGTKGSFAIAQLTDLLFVKFLLKKHYPEVVNPFFKKVGDDLIVYDPKLLLRESYEQIGVPINMNKSKFRTSFGSFYEFVSRNGVNGKDYSLISPTLIPHYRRNDFYLATLYYHVAERSNILGSVEDLIKFKRDYLKGLNKDLEKYDGRVQKVMKIITLLGHMEGNYFIKVRTNPWKGIGKEELLTFLEILIKATLGDFIHKILMDLVDEVSGQAKSTVYNLVQEQKFTTVEGLSSSSLDLQFAKFVQNGLLLHEAIAVQQASHVVRGMRTGFRKGSNYLEELSENKIPVFIVNSDHGLKTLHVNPLFLDFILSLADQVGQKLIGYKTLKRVSLLDKANTEASIHLHSHLYNILCLTESPLDISTGSYTPNPLSKEPEVVTFDPNLVGAYVSLLGLDDMLASIANVRKDEATEVSLFPNDFATGEESTG